MPLRMLYFNWEYSLTDQVTQLSNTLNNVVSCTYTKKTVLILFDVCCDFMPWYNVIKLRLNLLPRFRSVDFDGCPPFLAQQGSNGDSCQFISARRILLGLRFRMNLLGVMESGMWASSIQLRANDATPKTRSISSVLCCKTYEPS